MSPCLHPDVSRDRLLFSQHFAILLVLFAAKDLLGSARKSNFEPVEIFQKVDGGQWYYPSAGRAFRRIIISVDTALNERTGKYGIAFTVFYQQAGQPA